MSRSLTAHDLITLVDDLLARHPPATTDPREFLGARFDAGLAWVWAGRGEGGLDADPARRPMSSACRGWRAPSSPTTG